MTGDPDLIEQYRQIHATTVYGDTSVKNLRYLRPEITLLKPSTILDYGCGQSNLLEELALDYPVELTRYDPAIPAYSRRPERRADLLLNVDVLEHIEERDLDAVVGEMAALCRNAIIIVDTRPAAAVLPDGRNAHVTIRSHGWWHERLTRYFPVLLPQATARRSRAGFRTWTRGPRQTLAYLGLRAAEDVFHYANRALAKTGLR